MKGLIIIFSLFVSNAYADIVCMRKVENEVYKVTISPSKVIVSLPGLSKPREFTNLNFANGLITDHGLAIFYQNHFGCIRNTLIITDRMEPFDAGYMQPMSFGTCSGGSTPDEMCGVDQ